MSVIITAVAFVGAVSAVAVSITSASGVNTVSTLALKLPRLTSLYAVCTHRRVFVVVVVEFFHKTRDVKVSRPTWCRDLFLVSVSVSVSQ